MSAEQGGAGERVRDDREAGADVAAGPHSAGGSRGRPAREVISEVYGSEGAPARPWHALPVEEVLEAFDVGTSGLTTDAATERLAEAGENSLPEKGRRSPLVLLARQFHNLLIYVLLAAGALSLFLDHVTDAIVIVAVVIVNAIIGFLQEGKAERALEAIRSMIDPKASVLRDGHRVTLAANDIVPGDVVLIEAGDRVPADLRLVRARNVKIEEAVLTGESVAVEKGTEPVAEDAALGDRASMAFSGTLVASGQGAGLVVGTGAATELGRISTLIGKVEELKTPLLRQIDQFARHLTFIIFGVAALTFLFALFVRHYELGAAFMAVIALAVSSIPAGLPAVMTITLAIGVQRMAARNAIIRRLPAVETLGSVSVICSDKTGTLTRNEMTARSVVSAGQEIEVTGVGYEPVGDFRADGEDLEIEDGAIAAVLIRAGLLCNDARLSHGEAGWIVDGDPMEGALVAVAMKAGLDPDLVRKQLPRDDEIPFDSAHRFMATLHHSHDDGAFILIKGAPERVLEMCSSERHEDGDHPIDDDAWRRRVDDLAANGQRILALAEKPAEAGKKTLTFDDVEGGATLLGVVGLMDPPREEAKAAVADCATAGIRVVMITGDHAATAHEIARQLGLAEDPRTLTGRDLEGLDDEGLQAVVHDTTVFARTTPEHKLRLVQGLQADRHIVAMTGDGVNDAPALKRADVGVAMGQKGTEAAKEASEMVLADDNFASIVAAVREGRTVHDNLKKVISWTLPTNGGESLTILAAIAFGLALPITPIQILWINMITAVTLGLTLAFEPTEPGVMRRPPRPSNQPILTGDLVWRVVFVSLLFVAGAFGVYYWGVARGLDVETARTLVINAIVVMEIFYLFNVRYVHGPSLTWRGLVGTRAVVIGIAVVVVAQLVFTYAPFMQAVFETRDVGLIESAVVIGCGVVLFLIVEMEKHARRAIFGHPAT